MPTLKRKRSAAPGVRPKQGVESPELVRRIVYSLLRAAVRTGVRAGMVLSDFEELARLAYFDEVRRRMPRDISGVAHKLGVSLRSANTLSKELKQAFFDAENEIEPVRRVADALSSKARTRSELQGELGDLQKTQIDRALNALVTRGWAVERAGHFELSSRFRSHSDPGLSARVAGLNHQMNVIAQSVWVRFVDGVQEHAATRTWTFTARREDIAAFTDETAKQLRHRAVDLEEAATQTGGGERYGMTISITPMEGK